MAEVVRGLIGTADRPVISRRVFVALNGGAIACPKDVAAVAAAMAGWSTTRRAWFQGVMEHDREADGSILVGNHSGLEYEILAELAGALLERAGQQHNTLVDFAKDPVRVGSEMEIAKAQSTLKGALKRDPPPQVAQPPQDMKGNGRGRGRKREGCFTCGEFGHRAAKCPQKDKRQRRDEAPRPPQAPAAKKGPGG